MQVKRNFFETIVNYAHVASQDETRPHLNAIAIEMKPSSARLVATNAHVLITSKHIVDNSETRTILFPRFKTKSLNEFLKQHKKATQFNLSYLEADNTIIVSSDNSSTEQESLVFRAIPRDFPNWRTVVPAKAKSASNICFNADFITTAQKAVAGTLKAKEPVRFDFQLAGEFAPMKATCKYNDIEHLVVLMPVKINREE